MWFCHSVLSSNIFHLYFWCCRQCTKITTQEIWKFLQKPPEIARSFKINDKITKRFWICHIFDFVILSFNCVFFRTSVVFINRKSNLRKGPAGSDGDIGARCIQYTFCFWDLLDSDYEHYPWTFEPAQFVRGYGVTVTLLVLNPSSL
jgi:hypothetical protein